VQGGEHLLTGHDCSHVAPFSRHFVAVRKERRTGVKRPTVFGHTVRVRDRLTLEPIADDPELGRWLAALEDGRRVTLRELETVTPQMVDWYPDAPLNSIGSLLYHIALIEADWVINEMLGLAEPPAELDVLLPWPDREAGGHLSRVDGQPLSEHLARLAGVRDFVLASLRPMTNAEFLRVRAMDDYDVSPNWALYHVIQHETEHRAHICWLRDTFPGGQ
jgi:uncharacterized damage-inducible protein DinB